LAEGHDFVAMEFALTDLSPKTHAVVATCTLNLVQSYKVSEDVKVETPQLKGMIKIVSDIS
jgi:ribosomal protein L30/L7E